MKDYMLFLLNSGLPICPKDLIGRMYRFTFESRERDWSPYKSIYVGTITSAHLYHKPAVSEVVVKGKRKKVLVKEEEQRIVMLGVTAPEAPMKLFALEIDLDRKKRPIEAVPYWRDTTSNEHAEQRPWPGAEGIFEILD